MAWQSPTGFNDPDNKWDDETNAYDENTGTEATTIIYKPGEDWADYWLELTHAALNCSKVQFWAYYETGRIDQIDLDVYYDDGWHDVYQGIYADKEWVEKDIPEGAKSVTAARVRFHNTSALGRTVRLYEFDFWEVEATPKTSSDTGSGVDAVDSLEKGEAKTSSDAGSGVEGTPMQSAILVGSETGFSIEALIARLLTGDETGTGIEVGGLLKNLFVSEVGQGSDSFAAKIEAPTKGGGMKLWI